MLPDLLAAIVPVPGELEGDIKRSLSSTNSKRRTGEPPPRQEVAEALVIPSRLRRGPVFPGYSHVVKIDAGIHISVPHAHLVLWLTEGKTGSFCRDINQRDAFLHQLWIGGAGHQIGIGNAGAAGELLGPIYDPLIPFELRNSVYFFSPVLRTLDIAAAFRLSHRLTGLMKLIHAETRAQVVDHPVVMRPHCRAKYPRRNAQGHGNSAVTARDLLISHHQRDRIGAHATHRFRQASLMQTQPCQAIQDVMNQLAALILIQLLPHRHYLLSHELPDRRHHHSVFFTEKITVLLHSNLLSSSLTPDSFRSSTQVSHQLRRRA